MFIFFACPKKTAVHLASLWLTTLRCSQKADASESRITPLSHFLFFVVLLGCVKWLNNKSPKLF